MSASLQQVVEVAARKVALRKRYATIRAEAERTAPIPDIVEWAERRFNLPETSAPIVLAPHQVAVLRHVFPTDRPWPYRTVVWSQPKKSGKTALAGMVARWAAETWGPYQEILCVGNDAAQAQERAYAAAVQSIELTTGYDRGRRVLPGEWRVLDAIAAHKSGSNLRAIATDYQGEAGANPSLTVYTELWGFIHTAALRFWAEMAPSPTRERSMRWVETYAGYEGESELLWALYESTVLNGRQMTAAEMPGAFAEGIEPDDPIPCYVNDAAQLFAYWDSGPNARRMPWQQGERGAQYYANEAATQTASQMTRLHSNEWVSAESSFVPIEAWDQCRDPWPLVPGEKTPLVVGLDAAVSGDCFAMVAVSRGRERPADSGAVRLARAWTPPKGGSIDFAGPEQALRELCKAFNVVQVSYDPYQLHDFATRLTKEGVAWFRPFPQGQDRLKADKSLLDLILQRRISHDGDPMLREHVQNANAKQGTNEDNKLRIVKKAQSRHVDLLVATSMASSECLRLSIG